MGLAPPTPCDELVLSLRLLGVDVTIRSTDPIVAGTLTRLLVGHPPSQAGAASIRHYLLDSGSGRGSRSRLVVDGDEVAVASSPHELLPTLLRRLDQQVVDRADRLLVHAGVVERAGTGVLLCGPTGVGKTTLTVGLLRAGFGYLSDEVAAFAWDSTDARVEPYARPISIDWGAWRLFPELSPGPESATCDGGTSQWFVPPNQIGTGVVADASPARVVVFPEHRPGAGTALEHVRGGRALIDLASNAFSYRHAPRRCLERLAIVTAGVVCYRLTFGSLGAGVGAIIDVVDGMETHE